MSLRAVSKPLHVSGVVSTLPCYEYTHGPVIQADGRVRFRLWAPDASGVALEVAGGKTIPMCDVGAGMYEVHVNCAPGTKYSFRLDSGLAVPDPASRLQDGDPQDASVVVDVADYAWRNAGWMGRPWSETVLYEVHVGLLGGFRGLQERLPDLADLGVTAIELMPIADFPGARNWGYDGVLPFAPENSYGSPGELKELIDTAHGLGIQVFLDVVYNHFGPEGNFLHTYAAAFFRDDIQTPWGPAIDFRQPQVRAFFAENALYWLREYRFDGLRLDAVHAIEGHDWLLEMAAFVRREIAAIVPGRHVHLVVENDDNSASLLQAGFDAQWNDDEHHVLHHMLTGEAQSYYADYADEPASRLARCLAQGFDYQGQPSPFRAGRPRGEPSAGLPPTSFVFFLQNHDQTGNRPWGERLRTLCAHNEDALRAAIALQLLTPQIPLLFMGEEYGALAPFLYFTSFKNEGLVQAIREGRQREHADATHRDGAPLGLPDPNDKKTWDACMALPGLSVERNREWRTLYGQLLGVRHAFIIPYLDGACSLSARVLGPMAVQASWQLNNGTVLSVYCNLSNADVAIAAASLDEIVVFEGPRQCDTRNRTLRACSTLATIVPEQL
ncbi:malto-oligosyltrehalose trehalohydrolase [Pusillimonas sp. ANT_WB101]|uniref:malto-oligosyltrehalose trehalohydrolase n=1 Tax=Pusillimonas sp. ANT_WB101 TaxID=2597356 RepID=UPI0011EC6751|nr:malto-oligosyltrehalose trehalohydrolase [Pusillimonas sp. ANT_WB101]KAA0890742.1 malto-oligosyltrehalose trehalohydrolase [Pusillimonas sp. ANT_WB101]